MIRAENIPHKMDLHNEDGKRSEKPYYYRQTITQIENLLVTSKNVDKAA